MAAREQPSHVGERLIAEVMQPMGLTQGALAEAMHSPRERERIERARPLTVAA